MGGLKRRNKDNFDMSKVMSKRIKQEEKKQKEEQRQAEDKAKEEAEKAIKEPSVELGKTNKLVFFRQYNTYQALLEIHSTGNIANKYVYAKVILYIMRWFKDRLRKGGIEDYPAISFLKDDYPMPEDYTQFDLNKVSNINGFDFIDFETAFLRDKKAWVVYLSEPDNGQERSDIQGRTFTTEISVYKQKSSVVLGIREACREPENNTEDATGYRPGFVRDMFYDDSLYCGIH